MQKLELKITQAYSKWKWCMLNNQYKGINIISANLRCSELHKKYKNLKSKKLIKKVI